MSGYAGVGRQNRRYTELITEGVTGMTFESRNADDLAKKIEIMWQSGFDYEKIAKASQSKYNSESYYEEIMKVYHG